MKFFFLVLALASVVGSVSAQDGGPRTLRNLPYVSGGKARQQLDLYLPAATKGRHPLIIWIHGGGWAQGSKEHTPAAAIIAQGYAVASINYRLSQHATFPAQIQDCKAAVRWLRANAEKYQINPDRIGVWGTSAGAHLAALLGTTGETKEFDVGENLDESSAVQCVVDWFGPADFLNWSGSDDRLLDSQDNAVGRLLGGTVSQRSELARKASPVYFVSGKSAPFLIMHGDGDSVVPVQQSRILHAALQKAGVESQLKVIDGAGHGGGAFNSPENLMLMAAFFRKHLSP
ncbi:MAG TPA: alpha/beta hydrolase [Chthoniobacterales bacterium]|jgi:acetyl esterase/lipase